MEVKLGSLGPVQDQLNLLNVCAISAAAIRWLSWLLHAAL